MSAYIKNSLKIASIIIGSIVGAGFASGQEILRFFTMFHGDGAFGIIFASLLFFLVCASVLEYVYNNKINNYSLYITKLGGKYAGAAIEAIVMLFLLVGFYIMIAGTGAYAAENYNINRIWGAALLSLLCGIVFLFNLKGVTAINVIFAPVLIIGIVVLGISLYLSPAVEVCNRENLEIVNSWFSSSIIYVSYNSIILIAILSNVSQYITSRKVIYIGSLFGAGSLCLMAYIIYIVSSSFYNIAVNSEIPIIRIIKLYNFHAADAYGLVLILAMFTSAASSGFCFLNKISAGSQKKMKIYAFIMCISAIPLSNMGFSEMIRWFYPIFGYIGLFQVILILTGYFSWFYKKMNRQGLESGRDTLEN